MQFVRASLRLTIGNSPPTPWAGSGLDSFGARCAWSLWSRIESLVIGQSLSAWTGVVSGCAALHRWQIATACGGKLSAGGESQTRQGRRSVDISRDANFPPAFRVGCASSVSLAGVLHSVTAQQEVRRQPIAVSQTKDDLRHLGRIAGFVAPESGASDLTTAPTDP